MRTIYRFSAESRMNFLFEVWDDSFIRIYLPDGNVFWYLNRYVLVCGECVMVAYLICICRLGMCDGTLPSVYLSAGKG